MFPIAGSIRGRLCLFRVGRSQQNFLLYYTSSVPPASHLYQSLSPYRVCNPFELRPPCPQPPPSASSPVVHRCLRSGSAGVAMCSPIPLHYISGTFCWDFWCPLSIRSFLVFCMLFMCWMARSERDPGGGRTVTNARAQPLVNRKSSHLHVDP